MKGFRPVPWAILFPLVFFFWGGAAVSGASLDFAVIQPGQPGTSREAQPVMDALASYLERKMGAGITVRGRYFNEPDPALRFLGTSPPSWAIVRIGFYMGEGGRFNMTPLASTLPGGYAKDIWRLVVRGDASGNWKAIKGKVLGNMLFETDAASRLLFGKPPALLPFTLKGTFRPLRSLRRVIRGKAAGVVLDRVQYESLKALPLFKEVKVIHRSGDLPTSPVVWLGTPGKRAERLVAVLMGMKDDKDAQTLLKLLQTEGFGPVDRTLNELKVNKGGDGSSP